MALELFVFSTNYTNLHEFRGQLPLATFFTASALREWCPTLFQSEGESISLGYLFHNHARNSR